MLTCIVAAACLTGLVMSTYPGLLDSLTVHIALASAIAFSIGLVIAGALLILVRRASSTRFPFRWKNAGAMAVVCTCAFVLLALNVPRRLAFAASRPAFERLRLRLSASQHYPVTINARAGVYRVDEYAADPRGGVYFRTHSGMDGIGPDRMSYGFCYAPNAKGSPFGAAYYDLEHMGGGWYCFSTSNDWF
jgi:hypothetical protein